MSEYEENTLIEQLKEMIRTNHFPTEGYAGHRQSAFPPVSEGELALAETQLGFVLPSFLRRIYLEVGNGGFGPGYGLFPLYKQEAFTTLDSALITSYLEMRSMSQQDIDEYWADEEEKPVLWPEQVLIICDWGCNIYTCLDCSSPGLPVFRMDANESLTEWAIEEAISLPLWLKSWMDARPIFRLDWQQAKKVHKYDVGGHCDHPHLFV